MPRRLALNLVYASAQRSFPNFYIHLCAQARAAKPLRLRAIESISRPLPEIAAFSDGILLCGQIALGGR